MAKKQNKSLKNVGTASIASGYVDLLNELKEKIRTAQLKAALAVNSELVFLYWEIGKKLSARMANEGWGAKVIDRLAHDLGVDFPGVSGFSPRNLRYMRKFAESYDDSSILQALLAKIPWWHNILLLEKLDNHEERVWYAEQTIINGWSGRALDDYYLDMLFYHIKLRAFCVVELKSTDFKPEYAGKMNFYLAAVDDQLKHPTDNPSIGMIICRTKNDLKVEYALKRVLMPMSVSEYEVKIQDSLPKELRGTLPTAKEIEDKLLEHSSEDTIDK